jgi:hypothetical protein
MNPVPLTLNVAVNDNGVASDLAVLINALSDRGELHAHLAVGVTDFIRAYLRETPRHNTASRLGASPTGFRERNAADIRAISDSENAITLIPRSTGLGRAFGDVTLIPGPGKTYLAIPADARSYGKSPRDFGEGVLKFAILRAHRVFPVLLFAADGAVAYWLRRSVTQKQDRSLLPSDEGLREVGRRAATQYLQDIISQ